MTVFFDQYIKDDIDAPGYEGVAAVSCAHVVTEPADKRALDHTLELIAGHEIDRVEFIHRPGDRTMQREYRGAILYYTSETSRPTPHVHVLNALLGYEGSGPMFARNIMEHFGMSTFVFNQMNGSVSRRYPYTLTALNVGGEWTYDREDNK